MRRLFAGLGLLTLVAAGCGGGGSEPQKPSEAIADAVTAAGDRMSEKVSVTGTSTLPGRALSFRGDGGYNHGTEEGWLHLTLSVPGGRRTTIDEAFVKKVFWLKSPLFTGSLPKGKQWLEVDLRKAGRNLGFNFKSLLGQTPGDAITQLGRTSAKATRVGTETIDGVETTHYRAPIDPRKVPANDRQQKLTAAVYKPLEVWIDGDDHVRQVKLDFTSRSDPAKPARGRTVVTMKLSDFGETVDVQPPAPSLVVDATETVGSG